MSPVYWAGPQPAPLVGGPTWPRGSPVQGPRQLSGTRCHGELVPGMFWASTHRPTQSGLGLPTRRLLSLSQGERGLPSAPSASPFDGGQAALLQVRLDVLLRVYLLKKNQGC